MNLVSQDPLIILYCIVNCFVWSNWVRQPTTKHWNYQPFDSNNNISTWINLLHKHTFKTKRFLKDLFNIFVLSLFWKSKKSKSDLVCPQRNEIPVWSIFSWMHKTLIVTMYLWKEYVHFMCHAKFLLCKERTDDTLGYSLPDKNLFSK